MKGLFVNNPKAEGGRDVKYNHSKDIKARRFFQQFYELNVMEMYTWMNFFAIKYHFDIKSLLELLLESLYDETKIDAFVYQMSRTAEKKDTSNFYYVVLKVIFQRYMASKEISEEIRSSVVVDLTILMDINLGMMVMNYNGWSLDFLHIRKKQVKFCKEEKIKAKLTKIFNGEFIKHPRGGEILIDFLNYLEGKQFLHDAETNRQIEEILSLYYFIYLKKRESRSPGK